MLEGKIMEMKECVITSAVRTAGWGVFGKSEGGAARGRGDSRFAREPEKERHYSGAGRSSDYGR